MEENITRRWVRSKQMADKLQVTTSTLSKWRMKGIGPRWSKVSRNLVLYDDQDGDRFVEEKLVSSTREGA